MLTVFISTMIIEDHSILSKIEKLRENKNISKLSMGK